MTYKRIDLESLNYKVPLQSNIVTFLNGTQQGNSRTSLKHFADDMSGPLSPMSLPAPKQLKFTPGIVNGSVKESATFVDQTRKVSPLPHAAVWIVTLLFD